MKKILEEARELEVGGEYDVLVTGGGPAGVSAAIAAASEGARTLLIEKHGFLGGMGTAGMVGSFCGFFTTGREKKMLVGGIAASVLDRLRKLGGLIDKSVSVVDPRIASIKFNPEIFKVMAEQFALEKGGEILYHTLVTAVAWERKGQRLSGVIVENKSGRSAILAKVVIDASGDGDVAFRAGVPCEYGDGKGGAQALTTIFRMINVDQEKMRGLTMSRVKEILGEANKDGRYGFRRVDGILNPSLPAGIVTANISSIPGLSAIDARELSKAEIEGRREAYEYVRAFRDVLPGFERAEISTLAPQVGIRETRRVKGEYVIQEEEVLKGRKAPDGIALGAWPVELHDPVTRQVKWAFLEAEDDYYSIPLGCLIPVGLENLLVAGRCISASHVAQASTRVIAQAFALGEAAGVLAAKAANTGSTVRGIPVQGVQETLRDRGALLEV